MHALITPRVRTDQAECSLWCHGLRLW